jgi:hypothetical protein
MKYEFGGKVYIQEKLVWGQVKQLASVLKGITIEGQMTVPVLIDLLGDKLPLAMAVVLTEEGTSPKDKNLEAIAKEFEFGIPVDIAFQVIEDFFSCNPIASTLQKLTGMMGSLQGNLTETLEKIAPEKKNTSIE